MDTFSYNTETAPGLVPAKKYELLPLYDDKNPMLALRQEALDPQKLPADLIEVCNRLLATMNHYAGVGLAAPQCGLGLRLFVAVGGLVFINPRIITKSIEDTRQKEGCLSFPGLYIPVTRAKTIEVEYFNEFGEHKQGTFTGATARVIQHETDHLNGVVFTSLVGNLTLQMAKKKKQKMFKRMERIVAAKEIQRRVAEITANKQAPRAITVQTNRVK